MVASPDSMPVHPIGLGHIVSVLLHTNKTAGEPPCYTKKYFPFVLLPFIRPFVLFLKSLSNDKALLLFERSEL